MLEYRKIIDTLLNSESGKFISEGTAYSFPVVARDDNGNLIDCFFLFGVEFPTGIVASPFARIGICPEQQKLAFYYTAEEQPFPSAENLTFTDLAFDDYDKLIEEYESIYPTVREFAFSNLLIGDQRKLLRKYFDTQYALFGGQWVYYRHLSPQFFSWIIRMLASDISFLNSCLEGDAELHDIKRYIEMAGEDKEDQRILLGMTEAEYDAWDKQGDTVLRKILHSRIMGEDFTTYSKMTKEEQLAARSYDASVIDKIKHEDT